MTTDVHLDSVRKAAKARDEAESAYRLSLLDAYVAGTSYSVLAAELGVSRQAVRQLIQRTEENMRRRLEEIDARYQSVVDAMTDKPGYLKRVTAYQNANSKKLGRRGLAYKPVSVQMRDYAESLLLETLEHKRGDPIVELVVAELDEAAAIRKRLLALDESRAFGAPLD